jgi:hypothetical protein
MLQLGEELGSGGQGIVYRIAAHPGLVFKQYKAQGADERALKILVDLPDEILPSERGRLFERASWPLARVYNKGQLSGFLMQEIPGQFLTTNDVGSRKFRELQYLVYPRKPLWGQIVPPSGISAQVRLGIVREFVGLVSLLHGNALIVGDVSMNNVLWTGTDGTPVAVFLIDCDGIRKLGSRPVFEQAETLDWNDPFQRPGGSDLDTDRYKLALLVGRVLSISAYARPGDSLQLVEDIPARVATRVTTLWQQAAGTRGTRPDAAQWTMALSDRDEIVLQPLPAVRRQPVLPHKPLDGDLGNVRPTIQLRPGAGTPPGS